MNNERAAGTIYGHLFENDKTECPLAVYWAIHIQLQTLNDLDEQCSVLIEWLSWPARSARELDGESLQSLVASVPYEASYYVGHHAPLSLDRLDLTVSDDLQIHVALSGTANVEMELARPKQIPVEIRADLSFDGIIVLPSNLGLPKTAEAASSALAPFVDLKTLRPPRWDRFRYLFEPC